MKERKPPEPPKLTTKRLFLDMMDSAHAAGMPCKRINLVQDAIRAMEAALTDIADFGRSYGTTDTDAVQGIRNSARAGLMKWNGGDHAEKA